jgi:hypothetical protein
MRINLRVEKVKAKSSIAFSREFGLNNTESNAASQKPPLPRDSTELGTGSECHSHISRDVRQILDQLGLVQNFDRGWNDDRGSPAKPKKCVGHLEATVS